MEIYKVILIYMLLNLITLATIHTVAGTKLIEKVLSENEIIEFRSALKDIRVNVVLSVSAFPLFLLSLFK